MTECDSVRMEFLREAIQNCVLDIERARDEVDVMCARRRRNFVLCDESRVKLALYNSELRLLRREEELCQHGG